MAEYLPAIMRHVWRILPETILGGNMTEINEYHMTENGIKRLSGVERFFEDHFISEEPYYLPIHDEVEVSRTAHALRMPVLLKVPPVAARPGS